jgi:hypothetical protein
VLRDFLLGLLPPPAIEQVAEHLEGCPHCVATLDSMTVEDKLTEVVKQIHTTARQPDEAAINRLIRKVHSDTAP